VVTHTNTLVLALRGHGGVGVVRHVAIDNALGQVPFESRIGDPDSGPRRWGVLRLGNSGPRGPTGAPKLAGSGARAPAAG
jgi:hypothetical protein